MSNKKNYGYQDILRINNRRKKNLNMRSGTGIKGIYHVDIEKGQIVVRPNQNYTLEVYSIEEFLYEFLEKDFIIVNPERLSIYNFDNLRLYTNPDEFEKDLIAFANNAALFGMDFIFNSFILIHTFDGWKVTGYTDEYTSEVIIPDFVTSIGKQAFAHFKSLETVRLPKGLKEIEEEAFYGCNKLQEIKFPQSLECIGKSAFAWCCGLTEICIPEKITVIEEETFRYTTLRKIKLPKNLKTIKRHSFSLTDVEYLNIPSVETIEACAFSDCNLKGTLRLPKNLKSFHLSSFVGTNIDAISIPKGADYVNDRQTNLRVIGY